MNKPLLKDVLDKDVQTNAKNLLSILEKPTLTEADHNKVRLLTELIAFSVAEVLKNEYSL